MRANGSSMQLDKLLDHGQSDSHSGLRAAGARISLPEYLEDMRQERRIHSLPVIRNCQHDPAALISKFDLDPSAFRCELHRIVQQVPDYLLQAHWIRFDKNQILRRNNIYLN